ncbi:MAG TPA: extracellular solute-binding protein, partial [Mesotoga sp.]|nr:extracellular solute-binding protein [Mesotoga sp.]
MRRSSLLVLLMLVVLAIAGVSQTINIWIGGQVAELDETWDMIIGKFEKETGQKVEVQLFGFDIYYDKLLTALQAGQGPDLAFADLGGWVPTFAEKGWLEPMGALLDSWDGVE